MTNEKYAYTITQTVREQADAFILECITPYCEEVTKAKLSKDDIKEALNVWQVYKNYNINLEYKSGKWVQSKDQIYWDCSECGWYNDYSKHFRFCPHCGAIMVEEDKQ